MKFMVKVLYDNGVERVYEIPQIEPMTRQEIIGAIKEFGDLIYEVTSNGKPGAFRILNKDDTSYTVINISKASSIEFYLDEEA
jgi:hypothetical protein